MARKSAPDKPIELGDGLATTLAVGEEDGGDPDPIEVTTMACGEEGNDCEFDLDPVEVTTMALGEEGDPCLLEPIEPIEMTTMALGEEGDDGYDIM